MLEGEVQKKKTIINFDDESVSRKIQKLCENDESVRAVVMSTDFTRMSRLAHEKGWNVADIALAKVLINATKDKVKTTSYRQEFGAVENKIKGIPNKELILDVTNGVKYVGPCPVAANEELGKKHVLTYEAEMVVSLCTDNKGQTRAVDQGTEMFEGYKMNEVSLSRMATYVARAEGDVSNVLETMKNNTGFQSLLEESAPSHYKCPVIKKGNPPYINQFSTFVAQEHKIEVSKGIVSYLHKHRLPKGPYREKCKSHVYGVGFPSHGRRYVEAVLDHYIPNDVDNVHIYDKDASYAVAFANRYPGKNFYYIGSISQFNANARIGTKSQHDMISNSKGAMRIKISYEKASEPNKESKQTVWSLGEEADIGDREIDKNYSYVSRYASVFAIKSGGSYRIGVRSYDGCVIVVKTPQKTYDDDKAVLSKLANVYVHFYNYLWIFSPLRDFYPDEYPPLIGVYTTMRTKEQDVALTAFSSIKGSTTISPYTVDLEEGIDEEEFTVEDKKEVSVVIKTDNKKAEEMGSFFGNLQ